MKIKLARTAGFCMGVRRAMEIAQDSAKDRVDPVFTHGELIHNRQAVEVLESQGITAIDDPESLKPGNRIVIRAHGIPKDEQSSLKTRGVECIDATCPHVLKSQKRIEKDSADGRPIVLVGDRDHAEMVGLAGHSSSETYIISTLAEAEKINITEPFSVLAQTTFNEETYVRICELLKCKFPDCNIYHSICRATADRQEEARQLAEESDAMVIVGGRHSANTCRLAEIGRNAGKPVFHVETENELDTEELKDFSVIGITAGASTPGWLLQTVINKIERAENKGISAKIKNLTQLCVKTYIYNAVGALSLSYAVSVLMNISLPLNYLAIVFSYILSIYTFNRYAETGRNTAKSLSGIFSFYHEHKVTLLTISLLLSVLSIYLARQLSSNIFMLIIVAYTAGIIYTIPILPHGYKYRSLKDIPASKDVFVSLAWTILITVIPGYLPVKNAALDIVFGASVLVFLLVFGKTVALDLRDTEGDRLIGTETIPVLIGKKRTLQLLYTIQILALLLIAWLSYAGVFTKYGYTLFLVPLYGLLSLRLLRRRMLTDEVKCQIIVDGQMIFSGIIVLGVSLVLRLKGL
ncbi:MAG: 4-hydroxy-3-methylbut-2-enyl diphosphate reductase [Planctomycetota bacterium]